MSTGGILCNFTKKMDNQQTNKKCFKFEVEFSSTLSVEAIDGFVCWGEFGQGTIQELDSQDGDSSGHCDPTSDRGLTS